MHIGLLVKSVAPAHVRRRTGSGSERRWRSSPGRAGQGRAALAFVSRGVLFASAEAGARLATILCVPRTPRHRVCSHTAIRDRAGLGWLPKQLGDTFTERSRGKRKPK